MYNLAEDPYASIVELYKAFREKNIAEAGNGGAIAAYGGA